MFSENKTKVKHRQSADGKDWFSVKECNLPIQRFFTVFFGIPVGKKSDKVIVPQSIRESSRKIKMSFLNGVLDTDGCITKKGFRLTTASEDFRDNVFDLLSSLESKGYKDSWLNKKYNKKYYGLLFYKSTVPFLCGSPIAVNSAGFR